MNFLTRHRHSLLSRLMLAAMMMVMLVAGLPAMVWMPCCRPAEGIESAGVAQEVEAPSCCAKKLSARPLNPTRVLAPAAPIQCPAAVRCCCSGNHGAALPATPAHVPNVSHSLTAAEGAAAVVELPLLSTCFVPRALESPPPTPRQSINILNCTFLC